MAADARRPLRGVAAALAGLLLCGRAAEDARRPLMSQASSFERSGTTLLTIQVCYPTFTCLLRYLVHELLGLPLVGDEPNRVSHSS